jgi:hypothetical protein
MPLPRACYRSFQSAHEPSAVSRLTGAWRGLGAVLCTLAASCAGPPKAPHAVTFVAPPSVAACTAQVDDAQEPPFVRNCYGVFSRAAAVAVAMSEWRAWGEVVYDGNPADDGPVDPETKAERQPGFWQRVGLYWWIGMNESDPSAGVDGRARCLGRYLRTRG